MSSPPSPTDLARKEAKKKAKEDEKARLKAKVLEKEQKRKEEEIHRAAKKQLQSQLQSSTQSQLSSQLQSQLSSTSPTNETPDALAIPFPNAPVSIGQKKNMKSEMAKSYHPRVVESMWDEWWEQQGLYHANARTEKRKKFVMVIPPV